MQHLKLHKKEFDECATKVADRKLLKKTQKSTLNDFFEVDSRPKIQKITIEIDPETLLESCVDLVAVNGFPLNIVEAPAFRAIIDPILNALPHKVKVNRRSVRAKIKERAEKEREKTKHILEGKLICLKFDFTKEILGVNVQVMYNNKIVNRALSMNRVLAEHSGQNTSSHISDILTKYGVSMDHVLTNTTDNAKNMVKCTKLMHDMQNINIAWYEEFHHDEDCKDCKDEKWNCQAVIFEMEDNGIICQVNCAPHSYQLGIQDFWKTVKANQLLTRSREAVKKLRTPTFIHIIKEKQLFKPILDVPTRWSSTFFMLKRLLMLRNFCEKFQDSVPELNLCDCWEHIENMIDVLQPANEATIIFQAPDLILPEYYKIWVNSTLKLESLNTDIGNLLAEKLNSRIEMIMSLPMLASLYLHPR